MKSSNKTVSAGAMIGLLAVAVVAHPAFAGGELVNNTSQNTNPTSITPIDNSTPPGNIGGTIIPNGSTTSLTQVSQQSGIVQVANWGGSSTLSPPSCNGGCFFAVTKATPATYGSGTNLEAMIGVTIPIGSSDGGMGEVNRLNAEMQKYRTESEIKIALSEKLADALENRKMERATIIAMSLAPLLGYKDYRLLLRDVSTPKPMSTNQLLGITQISSAVMY